MISFRHLGQSVRGEKAIDGAQGVPLGFPGDLLGAPIGFVFGVPVDVGADLFQRAACALSHGTGERVYRPGVPQFNLQVLGHYNLLHFSEL